MTNARGGKREGAGRKPTGRNTKVLRLDADLADYLNAFLKVHSSAEVINRLQQSNTEQGSGGDGEQRRQGDGEQGSRGVVGATASASKPDGETKNPLRERLGDEAAGVLPGPIEDVEIKRAKAQPQTPSLNSDQQRAIALLTRWWNGNERMASLSGAAGTGKTFCIGHWLNSLKRPDAIFLAPTHKAKKMLQQSLAAAGTSYPVYTVAQGLGKQPVISEKGDEEFVTKKADLVSNTDLVIVDEAGMVSDEDFHELAERSARILWLGDRFQLPPIGEAEALAFSDPRIQYRAELTQIMRYSGYLAEACQQLRDGVKQGKIYPIVPDGKQIIALPRKEWFEKAITLFQSPEFETNSSYCRMLAFRNAVVDTCNQRIKPAIYGHSHTFFKNQKLIATKPIQRLHGFVESRSSRGKTKIRTEWQILATNSEELLVTADPEIRPITAEDLAFAPPEVMSLIGTSIISFPVVGESGLEFQCLVLTEEAKNQSIKIVAEIKRQRNLSKSQRAALAYLYRFGDEAKDIFALTVHKSQGSTYNHVFIDIKDIMRPPLPSPKEDSEPDIRHRLIYTAISRASEQVYLAK